MTDKEKEEYIRMRNWTGLLGIISIVGMIGLVIFMLSLILLRLAGNI